MTLLVSCRSLTGETKAEDTANKEPGEEKPEEDNDYHRSDEQVSSGWRWLEIMFNPFDPSGLSATTLTLA